MSKDKLKDEISLHYRRFCLINEEKAKALFNKIRADCLKMYSDNMQKSFDSTKSHFEKDDLQKLHEKAKNESTQSVCLILYFYQCKRNRFYFQVALPKKPAIEVLLELSDCLVKH